MSTIFQGFIYFGNKDEDSSENPYIWGKLISKTPKDDEGNDVKNPGSLMIYGAKGIQSGDCGRKVLLSRGIPGLYDLVPADKVDELLVELEMEIHEIPEVPVAESQAAKSSISREDASKKAREARQARRGAKSVVATPVMETAAQPE
jgi:hypothetical protein